MTERTEDGARAAASWQGRRDASGGASETADAFWKRLMDQNGFDPDALATIEGLTHSDQ
jgi:hypothetical protein